MEIKQSSLGPTWAEIEAQRMERDDRPVRNRFAQYASLGRGHLHPELCGWRADEY